MSHKRPPVPVIILLVIAIFVAAYFGIRALTQKEDHRAGAFRHHRRRANQRLG